VEIEDIVKEFDKLFMLAEKDGQVVVVATPESVMMVAEAMPALLEKARLEIAKSSGMWN